MRKLSELQKDILTVISSSPKLLVTNQIATILRKDQTTIFNSVESLIERGMLEAERERDGIKKFLKLTEMGVCYAVETCHVYYEDILQNHPYLKPFREVEEIQQMVISPRLRQEAYQELAFDRMFDDELNENYRGDTLRFFPKTSSQYMERVLDAVTASVSTYRDFGVNYEEIKKYIEQTKIALVKRMNGLSERYDRYADFEKKWIEWCQANASPVDLSQGPQKPSLKEFYQQNKPASFFHEIIIFVYYLTKFNKQTDVSYAQIMACYFEVGQKPPQIGDAIPHPDNQGLLSKGPGEDIIRLTPLGERFVELRMDLEMKRRRESINQ